MFAYCLYNAWKHLDGKMTLDGLVAGKHLDAEMTLNGLAMAMANSDLNEIDKKKATAAILNAGKNCIEPFVPKPKTEASANDENILPYKYSRHIRASVVDLCRKLNFAANERTTAEDMAIEFVSKSLHSTRRPASIAGIIIWVCSLMHKRQVNVQLLAKYSVKPKTLLETYNELEKHFRDLEALKKFGNWEEYSNNLRAP